MNLAPPRRDSFHHLKEVSLFLSALLFVLVMTPPLFAEEVEVIDFGDELSEESASEGDTSPTLDEEGTETLDFGEELESTPTEKQETSSNQMSPSVSVSEQEAPSLDRTQFSGEWHALIRPDFEWGDGEDIFEADSGFSLGLQWEQSNRFRVVIRGHMNYWLGYEYWENTPENKKNQLDEGNNPHYALAIALDEAYLNWRFNDFSLTIGNTITSWGSTLLSQPANVINPLDLNRILGPYAGRRIAQPSLILDVFKGSWGLQFVIVPFFAANTQWLFGRDSAQASRDNLIVGNTFPFLKFIPKLLPFYQSEALQRFLTSAGRPSLSPLNTSAGLRITGTAANTDYGIGYFYGWDREPFVKIDKDLRIALKSTKYFDATQSDLKNPAWWANVLAPLLKLSPSKLSLNQGDRKKLIDIRYERLHTFEVDFSRYFGPIGVKFDGVFQPAKTFTTQELESVRRPKFSTALGLNWDRVFSNDAVLSLNLEGFFDYVPNANSSTTHSFVPEEERGKSDDRLLLYPNGMMGGLFFQAFSYLPAPKLTIQTLIRSDLTKPDIIASFELSRPLISDIKISIGALFFYGPPLNDRFSVGGLYRRDDAAYLMLSGDI